MLEEIFKKEFK